MFLVPVTAVLTRVRSGVASPLLAVLGSMSRARAETGLRAQSESYPIR